MYYMDGKGHKSELESNRNYFIDHIKPKSCHYSSYLWPIGWMHAHEYVYTHTHMHI